MGDIYFSLKNGDLHRVIAQGKKSWEYENTSGVALSMEPSQFLCNFRICADQPEALSMFNRIRESMK